MKEKKKGEGKERRGFSDDLNNKREQNECTNV